MTQLNEAPRFYKISEACKVLGLSQSILRRWDKEGLIETIRTPGNIRLFDISSIHPNANVSSYQKKEDRVNIFYSRVSSAKQKDDLERQKECLRSHYADQYLQYEEITDIGSGINFKRPGLLRILGLVKQGKVSTLVVASRDRLARFGVELIEWICNEFGTKIMVHDSKDTTPETELGNDLMAIVQVYCCRWNGKRRYNSKNKTQSQEIETSTHTRTEKEI
jgi:predicted site-specific integrase-resolvase